MPAFIDLTNQKFGKWTVVSRAANKNNRVYWECMCDCGKRKTVMAVSLRSGASQSCCCKRIDHGMANAREYSSWVMIRQKCKNPKADGYKNYGGRGITICKRWEKFENFYKDMGAKSGNSRFHVTNTDKELSIKNCLWSNEVSQMKKVNKEKRKCNLINSHNYTALHTKNNSNNNTHTCVRIHCNPKRKKIIWRY